ncbi:MAG: helix-turn-helix transcriptional regulator [Pseudomonadota bacterium]
MRGVTFKILQDALHARGMTYADLAAQLELSEPTVKRIFAGKDCKFSRLLKVCDLLEIDLADVLNMAGRPEQTTPYLPYHVEAQLAADLPLFYFFILLRDTMPQEMIARRFDLSQQDIIRFGLALEKLGLAELMPDDRIRLSSESPVRFRHDGPLIPMIRAINLKFFSQVVSRPETETQMFFTISRRMLPATAEMISAEIRELQDRIGKLARQDQLVSDADALVTFKLTGVWGPVVFSELMTLKESVPAQASAPG